MRDLELKVVLLSIIGSLFLDVARAGAGDPAANPPSSTPATDKPATSKPATSKPATAHIKFEANRSFYGPITSTVKWDTTRSFYRPDASTSQYENEFRPGTSTSLQGRVSLSMAARNLYRRDLISKSDPMCVVHEYDKDRRQWTKRGQTETWEDVHNPDFVEKVEVTHMFEEERFFLFHIYDIDSTSPDLDDHDFLGYVKISLAEVVAKGRVELQLNKEKNGLYAPWDDNRPAKRIRTPPLNKSKPYIVIWAENLTTSRLLNEDRVFFQLSGSSIARRNLFGFGKSNPYFAIYKVNKNDPTDWIPVYALTAIQSTRKPAWKKFSLPFSRLADADPDRKILFRCKNQSHWKEHEIIGEVETTIRELDTTVRRTFPLIDPKKRAKHPKRKIDDFRASGYLKIQEFVWWKTYPFLSYVMGGLNINCIIAIDYTASNLDPKLKESLHHKSPTDPTFMNPYEHAITAVVSIIEKYNKTRKFLVLGFGAELPPPAPKEVNHMFYVNLNQDTQDPYNDPYFHGVDGVLDGYRACLSRIMLSTPTYFQPVIKHVVEVARGYENGDEYFILLILTDGKILDMDDTISAIIEASALPISIIIIGIGNEDFTSMNELDADDEPLWMDGKEAERDIVQFVHFDKFFRRRSDRNARNRLAKEVLREVPRQLITYMASRGFVPKEPIYEPHDLPEDPNQLNSDE